MSETQIPSLMDRLKGRITKFEDTPITLNAVYYSESGVGKSTAAGIAPKPFIINCEGGTTCFLRLKKWMPQLDIEVFKPENFNEIRDAYAYLKNEKHDRQTVILDSLTEIAKMSMDGVLADPRRDEKYDPEAPVLQDQQKMTNQMRNLVRAFRDLPLNCIFVCLDQERQDQTTGAIKVMPALTPKLAEDVYGYMDVVGYMFVDPETGARKMLTQNRGKYIAKDRFGRLGAGMIEPTTYHLLNKITGLAVPTWVEEMYTQELKKDQPKPVTATIQAQAAKQEQGGKK